MWAAAVPLVLMLGEAGAAIALLAVHVGSVLIWGTARRLVPFRVLKSAALTWLAAAPAGAVAFWWNRMWPMTSAPQLIVCGAAALLPYAVINYYLQKPRGDDPPVAVHDGGAGAR